MQSCAMMFFLSKCHVMGHEIVSSWFTVALVNLSWSYVTLYFQTVGWLRSKYEQILSGMKFGF